MEHELEEIIVAIEDMLEDNTIPKNVKRKIEETKQILLKTETAISIRINQALNKLEELSEETNINPFTRTQIWNIVSMLGAI